MEDVIVNKVAKSGIITLDLEQFLPEGEIAVVDLKDFLFMELILKEKEFREKMKSLNWELYMGKNVALMCSADAIIPLWAYMLTTSYLQQVANNIVFGTAENLINTLLLKNLKNLNIEEYEGARVVVKGCGDKNIPETAYVEVTRLLMPVAKSIMYGEPCSTVPIYKALKKQSNG